MNAPEKPSEPEVKPAAPLSQLEGLALLRKEFPLNLISKLPKATKAQNECPANEKVNCKVCGGWHHPRVQHLDYVGHAALTDRLLDADPMWNWEPVSVDAQGQPVLDKDGGMWIKLTVCGVTRLGYGDAQGKTGPNAVKERIGDALRNAAIRFGAALDLWSKVDLHFDEHGDEDKPKDEPKKDEPKKDELPAYPDTAFKQNFPKWKEMIEAGKNTPARIIAMVSSKATLTEDQKIAINNVKAKENANANS